MAERLAGEESFGKVVEALAASVSELVEDPNRAAFIGIHTHGIPLGKRIQAIFDKHNSTETPFGEWCNW